MNILKLVALFAALAISDAAFTYEHTVDLSGDKRFILSWSIVDPGATNAMKTHALSRSSSSSSVFSSKLDHYKHTVKQLSGTGTTSVIRVKIDAQTTGWVGLGLHPEKRMIPDADMLIAHVDSGSKKVYVTDRNTFGFSTHAMPKLDTRESDWTVDTDAHSDGGYETSGRTVVHLMRKIRTCDEEDRDVPTGTARVLWAFAAEDQNVDTWAAPMHSAFGSLSVDLYARDPRAIHSVSQVHDKDKEEIISVKVDQFAPVTIPHDDDTYYHCRAVDLGADVQGRHLVAYGMEVQNLEYVHHALLYQCEDAFTEEHVKFSGDCHAYANMPNILKECNGGTPVAAWAVGGDVHVFPDGIGVPLGRYYLLETHYDNQRLQPGVQDHSALELLVTKKGHERSKVGQILPVGAIPRAQFIPGNTRAVTHSFRCPSTCTKDWDSEITAYSALLHGHLTARGVALRHYRDGKELRPISEDASYDFNLQNFRDVTAGRDSSDAGVVIKPGDDLVVECTYDTSGRKKMVYGGNASKEEMCLSYILVSPPVKDELCWSEVDLRQVLTEFGSKVIASGLASEAVVQEKLTQFALAKSSTDKDKALDELGITWTKDQVGWWNKAYANADQYNTCGDGETPFLGFVDAAKFVPEPVCPGDPTPVASSSGDGGDDENSASASFASPLFAATLVTFGFILYI